jgi:muramoyltetrapeptide carboxypeptidase
MVEEQMTGLLSKNIIDIVAPGSMKSDHALEAGKQVLMEWGFQPRAPHDIFGPDILYTNNCAKRLQFLIEALHAADSNTIWCLRGGSGSTRLIPGLEKIAPVTQKLFIGFSDITALHIFFYQNWGWQTCIHGPALKQVGLQEIDTSSVVATQNILSGKPQKLKLPLEPLNERHITAVSGPLTGGNASLVQASLGTSWQLKANDHILILEDVDEKPYRTAERLEHLRQAGIFKHIKALIFGDFNFNSFVDEVHIELYPKVLRQFASEVDFPVFKTTGIGHGKVNHPFIYGKMANILTDSLHNIILAC